MVSNDRGELMEVVVKNPNQISAKNGAEFAYNTPSDEVMEGVIKNSDPVLATNGAEFTHTVPPNASNDTTEAVEEVVKNPEPVSATNAVESTPNGTPDVSKDTGEVREEVVSATNGDEFNIQVFEHVSTSQRRLLNQEDSPKGFRPKLTILPPPCRVTFSNCNSPRSALPSPFQQLVQDKERMSKTVPSSLSRRIRERLGVPSVHDISWASIKKMAREWIKNPMNMAFLVWCVFVCISSMILFMLMTGMLNHVMRSKSQRNKWTEVHNQILNALFTLMCLYQHPHLMYHLVLLVRWKPEDIKKLRKIYCKHGTYKPHEWAHMLVVVILLNLNCLGQYALCGMNLGFRRSERPAIGVGICTSLTTGPAAAAGVYSIMSPLGREYDTDSDIESQGSVKSLQRRYSFSVRQDRKVVEENPQWRGGIFDIWEKIYVAYLSLFCSFCVFGYNMERLGFGNMYVHIVTFLLFCVAPFWIFNLAAINIEDGGVREVLGLTGVVLCIFGLLYGGFWRIQIRKRYNLPPNNLCCGYPAVTDCCQWLFCCWCSLAQEVRTRDFYDITENKFCSKQRKMAEQYAQSPLRLEGFGSFQFRSNGGTPYLGNSGASSPALISPTPSRFSKVFRSPDRQLVTVDEESPGKEDEIVLAPPVPLSIQREEIQIQQRPFQSENDYATFQFN